RFGIIARLYAVGNSYGHPQWVVEVTGVRDELLFLEGVGTYGPRVAPGMKVRERLQEMTAAGRFDTIPSEVWERVRDAMQERSMSRHRLQLAVGTQSRGDLNDEICPSRSRLARIAEVLEDSQLQAIAGSDVFWDSISSVESVGLQPVYDAT